MADDDNIPRGITSRDAKRIARVVKRDEARYQTAPAARARYQGRQKQASIAKTGSAIPAMSGLTPGSGTVTLHYFDGTVLVADEEITAYSNWSTDVGASTFIHLTWMYGVPWVSAEDCP